MFQVIRTKIGPNLRSHKIFILLTHSPKQPPNTFYNVRLHFIANFKNNSLAINNTVTRNNRNKTNAIYKPNTKAGDPSYYHIPVFQNYSIFNFNFNFNLILKMLPCQA